VGIEIERKFLVDLARLGRLAGGEVLQQGYVATAGLTAVRVRLVANRAWLTLKGEPRGTARSEFEYEIPMQDAREILAEFCGAVIAKTRYRRDYQGHTWEIDVFDGSNAGLVIAEVELDTETDAPALPDWVTEEVTGDPRYYNANLATHPFREWAER
jgi:adenylate cyclase